MDISQADIYNYLRNQLPLEYAKILNNLRTIKDAVPHPGRMPAESSNEYITVGMDGLADQIRAIFSTPGVGVQTVKLSYFKPHDEHVVEAEDWFYNRETGDEDRIVFDRVVPAQMESVGITYTINSLTYRADKYRYDQAVIAHQQSTASRREHIEHNHLVESKNNEIIRDARNKNIELWRTVAKALSAGETPDIKSVKIQMLRDQLSKLEENNGEKE